MLFYSYICISLCAVYEELHQEKMQIYSPMVMFALNIRMEKTGSQ